MSPICVWYSKRIDKPKEIVHFLSFLFFSSTEAQSNAQMLPKNFSWRISRLACSFSCTLVLRDCFACWRFAQASCACYNACGTILKYEFSSWIIYPSKQIQSIILEDISWIFFSRMVYSYILWSLITELCKVSSRLLWVL